MVFIERKCHTCDGSGLVFRKNAKWGNACPRCNGMGSIGECREATPEEMKPYEPTEFGEWMLKKRVKYEVTYSRLAELTGLRISRLSEIERGKGEPATEEERELVRAELRRIHREARKAITDAKVEAEFAEIDRMYALRKSAPGLLAALYACTCAMQLKLDFSSRKDEPELVDALDKARAAIRKAEGEQ